MIRQGAEVAVLEQPEMARAAAGLGVFCDPSACGQNTLQQVWSYASSPKPSTELGPFWSAPKGFWAGRRPAVMWMAALGRPRAGCLCGQPTWRPSRDWHQTMNTPKENLNYHIVTWSQGTFLQPRKRSSNLSGSSVEGKALC